MVNEFLNDLKEKGIILDETMVSSFSGFYNDLIEKNKITNLTRIVDEKEVYYYHFFDSLMVSLAIDNKEAKLLDIGTGPGFPGIPLKIAFPSLDITMVEATNKKVNFVLEEINNLSFKNIKIYHQRAEDFKGFDEFDYVTLRAVAPFKELLTYTIPFLKVGGRLIAMKSELKAAEEIEEAKPLLKKLNSKLIDVVPYKVLDRNYCLVVIEKIDKTPKGYPKPIHKDKNGR